MIPIEKYDAKQLVCFSHVPWNFVCQRPQHLLSRFTNKYTVYYIEEFVYRDEEDGYSIQLTTEDVALIIPYLDSKILTSQTEEERKEMVIETIFAEQLIETYIFWYYTPMALAYTAHFNPQAIVYDCIEELSAFKFGPAGLKLLERELFYTADVVFTGGNNLFQAKKHQHPNIHCFPNSIDKAHFEESRENHDEMADQANIPHPRLGFYGVIDERFDVEMIKQAAEAKPDWHFVLVGPVIKIDTNTLPKNKNVHYLGPKTYDELPIYLSGWDIALIPFVLNESTKYISPNKTLEYLAGGKPVISSAIIDVVHPYEALGLVHIVDDAAELVQVANSVLNKKEHQAWLTKVDEFLSHISWDDTCEKMDELLQHEIDGQNKIQTTTINQYV